MAILLTGASGFIGQRYIEYSADYNIISISLRKTLVKDIDFSNIGTILHMAGKAHQMQKIDDQIYFDVNYTLTKKLANAAKKAGVKHFVFISTIKVYGENPTTLYTEETACVPKNDPYGESKLKAEKYLQSIEDDTFKVAIVRPPLVYGPGVKGNLIRFLKLGEKGYPLPFANINNRRTMVYLNNLIELINKIIDIKASGIFLAGDREPISTTKLISEIRNNLGKKTRLFKMPTVLKKMLQAIKPGMTIRLFGSLEMDTSLTNKNLNFTPPYTIEDGIKDMVDWYKNSKNKN
jgi:nucleoside-diphosphate-sugar epimerase